MSSDNKWFLFELACFVFTLCLTSFGLGLVLAVAQFNVLELLSSFSAVTWMPIGIALVLVVLWATRLFSKLKALAT